VQAAKALLCGDTGTTGHFELEDPLNNDGDFKSLFRFKVYTGDQELAKHLNVAAANTACISLSMQNEVFAACNKVILARLIERV